MPTKRPYFLLIEDNATDIELTLKMFSRAGVGNEIMTVRDGQQALDFLFGMGEFSERNLLHQPQLILLDLNLPRIDGMEVLRRIRADERTRHLLVLVLTSYEGQQKIVDSLRLGVKGYLRKPVTFEQFISTMTALRMRIFVLRGKR